MHRFIRHNSKRGATIMLLTVMTPFLLIPAAGLAIDATVIHIVQTKLQAAVDASALGSGRLLGTQANITEIAGEFFKANFTVGARGFWGATLPNPTSNPSIVYTTGITKQITVNATANVPTLFMRIFGYTQANVSAVGQASRRDARVVFVIDRSGSMDQGGSGQPIGDVKQWVQTFIKEFTPGLDEVGLIVFDGTGVVGYPSSNSYSTTVSATAGGPDTSFWNSTSGGKSTYPQDAVYQTGQVGSGGGTGTADALSLAYIELQKAHLRDLANGADNKTNAILLFTDGVPSAISLFGNDPNHGGPWLSSSSGCSYRTSGSTNPIYFWLDVGSSNHGNPPYTAIIDVNKQVGSYKINSTYTPNWWMQNAYNSQELASPSNPNNESGCNISSTSVLTQIPSTDLYGNATTGGDSYVNGNTYGYKDSYFIGTNGTHQANAIYSSASGDFNSTQTTSPYHWGLAMWNAADNAAYNIRTDASHTARGETALMNIQILTIGYSGDGGTDAGLLKRISNDPNDTESPNALPTSWAGQPQGKFCLGTDLSTLQACVNVMSSILLHLTK